MVDCEAGQSGGGRRDHSAGMFSVQLPALGHMAAGYSLKNDVKYFTLL